MIQNALLSTSCAAKPFLAVFRHELSCKNTNFMSMTVHTALYKGWGGGGWKKNYLSFRMIGGGVEKNYLSFRMIISTLI